MRGLIPATALQAGEKQSWTSQSLGSVDVGDCFGCSGTVHIWT